MGPYSVSKQTRMEANQTKRLRAVVMFVLDQVEACHVATIGTPDATLA